TSRGPYIARPLGAVNREPRSRPRRVAAPDHPRRRSCEGHAWRCPARWGSSDCGPVPPRGTIALATRGVPPPFPGVSRPNSSLTKEPIVIQNPIPWPDGKRCAVAFTFDMDAESLMHLYFHDTAPNRVGMGAMLRYDAEVAVPRLLDLLRRYGLRQTFFVPGWCVERYPRAVEAILTDGHELGHHGYMHEKLNQLSREDERAVLQRAMEALVKASGQRPRGFRAPSYSFSKHTLGLLLDEGFVYDASLKGDDIPYALSDGRRTLVELPSDLSLDDWTQYVCLKDFGYMLPIASPQRAMEVFRAEFDAAWKYGALWVAVWH